MFRSFPIILIVAGGTMGACSRGDSPHEAKSPDGRQMGGQTQVAPVTTSNVRVADYFCDDIEVRPDEVLAQVRGTIQGIGERKEGSSTIKIGSILRKDRRAFVKVDSILDGQFSEPEFAWVSDSDSSEIHEGESYLFVIGPKSEIAAIYRIEKGDRCMMENGTTRNVGAVVEQVQKIGVHHKKPFE